MARECGSSRREDAEGEPEQQPACRRSQCRQPTKCASGHSCNSTPSLFAHPARLAQLQSEAQFYGFQPECANFVRQSLVANFQFSCCSPRDPVRLGMRPLIVPFTRESPRDGPKAARSERPVRSAVKAVAGYANNYTELDFTGCPRNRARLLRTVLRVRIPVPNPQPCEHSVVPLLYRFASGFPLAGCGALRSK
jgi:hypothetical protein